MLIRRTISATIISAVITLALAACGDEDTNGIPTESGSESAPTASSTPSWTENFTAEEIAEYDKALARWTEYEQRAEPLWAAGKATPAAQELFREYWITWPNQLNTLRYYEKQGWKVNGLPTVKWSRPASVEITTAGRQIKIEQCVDVSSVKVSVPDGTKVEQGLDAPYLRTVTLSSNSHTGGTYKATTLEDWESLQGKVEPCEP